MTKEIYKTFEQWMNGNFLEVKEPRKKAYSKDELLLVEMGWKYGYDAGRAVEQALDKKAENARELGLDYEPSAKVRDFWEGYVPEPVKPAPVQEPVAWMTINPYGEEDDIWYENPEGHLIEGWTYKPLYAHPAPVQEPVHQWRQKHSPYWYDGYPDNDDGGGPYETRTLYTTPPAAQRPFVGLTDEELREFDVDPVEAKLMIAKLRSNNNG